MYMFNNTNKTKNYQRKTVKISINLNWIFLRVPHIVNET